MNTAYALTNTGNIVAGLLKLSTFGFMLLGQLVDIILIATQVS